VDDGRTVLDVDLVGTARLLAALEPHVGAGTAAVCIASIAGHSDLASEANAQLDDPLAPGFIDTIADALDVPLDGAVGYVLAKRGVIRLCERLAGPWGARGGRVVSVSPGLIDTEMGRFEFERQEIMKAMAEFTPVQRERQSPLPGLSEDIAATVAFLCSDDAAFISGCDIRVDGGLLGAGRSLGFTG
jgi:NAD(P)-dependent dehydrogenase (short-subunit alcohol dehydrogenase family)